MRKRRVCLLLIAVLLFVGWLVDLSMRSREPEYAGKRLSEWVLAIRLDHSKERVSERAIRQMGTNAIPYLVKWLGYEAPPWKRKLNAVRARLNPRWKRRDKRDVLAEGAESALVVLGPQAEQGLPELASLLNDRNHREAAARACLVLINLGRRGEPLILAAMTNRQPWLASTMTKAAWDSSLNTDDAKVREAATNALRVIDPQMLQEIGKKTD